MYSLRFWTSWPLIYKRLLAVTAAAFLFSLAFLWMAYFQSPSPAIAWEYIVEQSRIQVPVRHFQLGLIEINVLGDGYLLFERMIGSPLGPQPAAAGIFLFVLVFSAMIMVAIITTLSRFWYSIGMGLFILFVVSFRLELLQVAGMINKIPAIAVLVVFVPVSFWFHAFKTSASFLIRLITFTALAILCGIVILLFSETANPFQQLAATAYVPAIVLCTVFILMVSHEIPASFVTLVSRGTRQRKSLNHFLIISIIYLVNLFLAYANKNEWIHWDFMVVNLFLLLTLSGILGVWGFRQRQPQYEGIIEADPFGVYFYISLGALSLSFIGWLIASVNDPAIEALRDIIIYSHLGYGIIFITYVISNFIVMLAENLQVYKVLYKPGKMPYFTFRFAGLITTLAFVFYNTWQVPIHNVQSGFYNAQGDVFKNSNPQLAEAYYNKGALYGFRNHHSNYAIADLKAAAGDLEKEESFYRRASGNRPTEMSYLNWSQALQREHAWMEASLALKDGVRSFPKSGPVHNTLGLMYANLGETDSAMMMLREAAQSNLTKNLSEANILGLAAIRNLDMDADSLFHSLGANHEGALSNALAFASRQEKKLSVEKPLLQDTATGLFASVFISNYIINHKDEVDTAFLNKVIALAHRPVNAELSEPLLFASAMALYEKGQVMRAFELMKGVIFYSENRGKYNNLLAQWALEQNAPEVALDFLSYSLSQNFQEAALTNAVALGEAGRLDEALIAWDTLKQSGDSSLYSLSLNMTQVLAIPANRISQLSDADKYQFTRYRIFREDSAFFIRTVNSITDQENKARALLDRTKKLLELDEVRQAVKLFQQIKGLRLRDKNLFNEIRIMDFMLLAEQGDAATLSQQLQNYIFNIKHSNEKLYLETLLAAHAGDITTSTRNFEFLSKVNPFFEEAVLSSADFFREHSREDLKAYTILAEALHENPQSVRLLKAYSLEAIRTGFTDYAYNSMTRLQALISKKTFTAFVAANRQALSPVIGERIIK